MRFGFLSLILLLVLSAYSQEGVSGPEISKALEILNSTRKAAGLDTVTISVSLSKSCYQYAKHLVINRGNSLTSGLSAHKEYPKLDGYTKEGQIAGGNSVIHYIRPSQAIDGWLITFYHRMPLLDPNMKEVGIAFFEKDDYVVSLMDFRSGAKAANPSKVVFYPYENQTNTPLSMGHELPDPIGDHLPYGFPVTISFARGQKITDVNFRLLDRYNTPVPCLVYTPEKPAAAGTLYQENNICAIPQKPLLAGKTYTVSFSCMVNGKPFKKTYSFDTI